MTKKAMKEKTLSEIKLMATVVEGNLEWWRKELDDNIRFCNYMESTRKLLGMIELAGKLGIIQWKDLETIIDHRKHLIDYKTWEIYVLGIY